MKRFWAFIAACLFLLLTACGGSTSTTEPVWQAELPNTGITVQVSGCTLEEKTASYWANPGAAGEPQSIMELYATDSAPLLEIAAPKAQVDIQFVQPVAGGMAAYDLALPVEQVDMVFLTQPEDNSTRVRFDTIYNFIVTVTSGDQIDDYFYTIKAKLSLYLTSLHDEDLLQRPENCTWTRFTLILAQFRHWHLHLGMLMGFVQADTGLCPRTLPPSTDIPTGPYDPYE